MGSTAVRTSEGVVPWPTEVAALYRELGYWDGVSLGDRFAESAVQAPDSVAVVDGEVRLTYAELAERVDAAAVRLLRLGLRPDDRLLVQLPGCWEFVALTLACFRAGIVPVMAMVSHREHELTHMAEIAQAVAVVVPAEFKGFDHRGLARTLAEKVPSLETVLVLGPQEPGDVSLAELLGRDGEEEPTGQALPRVDAPGVAVLLLSGGTTGLPKLIPRAHDDYSYCARRIAEVAGIDSRSVYLVTLPPGHNFPLTGILGALFAGGRVVMLPSPEPVKAFAAIERHGVTHAAIVPAVARRWLDHQDEQQTDQLRTLAVLQVGGSRLPDELARRVRPVTGAILQQEFGMAEGLVCMTRLDDPEEIICTTQGRPISESDEMLIVDEYGLPVPNGTPGGLLTRGPYTLRGYFRAPEHNTRAFTEDGWYASGDVVMRRADGNVVVLGRDKDLINRGGEKISAEEVESLAYRIDVVEMAAAVSMPDPVLGERLCLYVTLRPGASLSLEDVRTSMSAAGIADYKLPERLELLDRLPLTKVGKIDKKSLREAIAAATNGGTR